MQVIIQTSQDELLKLVRDAVREELKNHSDTSLNNTKSLESKPPATRKEACKFLNISIPTLDKLIKSNQLPAFFIGRQVRIKWIDLDSYINDLK